jgi:exonuclease SbcC
MNISKKENELKEVASKIELDVSRLNNVIQEYKSKIENLNVKIERTKNKEKDNKIKIHEILDIIKAKEEVETLKEIIFPIRDEKKEIQNEISLKNEMKGRYQQEIVSFRKQIKEYKEKQKDLSDIEERQRVLAIYRNLVNKDGLPLYILKSKIDVINTEINVIVNQIFDFDIIFTVNEDDGELTLEFLYDEDNEKNDISLASGAETFLINLCIKVGLTQISQIPKLKSLIVDEGFGTLDKDNIDKIPELFESLMTYYKNIILISHLDEMKELYKHSINLVKDGKYTEIID